MLPRVGPTPLGKHHRVPVAFSPRLGGRAAPPRAEAGAQNARAQAEIVAKLQQQTANVIREVSLEFKMLFEEINKGPVCGWPVFGRQPAADSEVDR